MTAPALAPILDFSFSRRWQAEILAARPIILPARHFTYPGNVEEIERGALEVLIRPLAAAVEGTAPGPCDRAPGENRPSASQEAIPQPSSRPIPEPFLATCALGFRDPIVPTGLWSTPRPEEICAVSGGYAYLIDTVSPGQFTMLPHRPVLELRPLPAEGLLLFIGHRSILAWGARGRAWESEKLSDEGVTVLGAENGILHGQGWAMMTDREAPFALDLRSGERVQQDRA